MSIEVQPAPKYDFRWTLCFEHTTLESKHVGPEHGGAYDFCDNNGGQMLKHKYVIITTNTFLCSAVVSLDYWEVFVLSGDVKLGVEISNVATYLLKLVVRKHASDSKSSSDVFSNQGFEMFEYAAVIFVLSSLPADPNLMCLDIVIWNRIPVTFMMSTARVVSLYCCIMKIYIEVFSILTFGDMCRTVLPFTQPRSGPHIKSAFIISYVMTGQSGIMFMLTKWI